MRIRPLLALALAIAPALPLAAADRAEHADHTKRPNVIVFLADDLGQECLGSYGGTSNKTPHLDALAAGGMRFTRAFAQPLCTPSRVQLMTGQYNHRNYRKFGELTAGQRTFGNQFMDAGYATGMVGKWQLGGDLKAPTAFGFQEYSLWQLGQGPTPRYWDPTGFVADGAPVSAPAGAYGPDLHQAYAKAFIDRHQDGPFLLYYANMLPHDPLQPTPLSAGKQGTPADNFTDMVQYLDHQVGDLVAHLKAKGLDRNTLLVFTGDNGTSSARTNQQDGRTVKGGKGSASLRGTQVPLIVSWPGTVAPGVCQDLVDLTDILPTIAEAAGLTPDAGPRDGTSVLPQAKGLPGTPRQAVYGWYSVGDKGLTSAVWAQDGRWWLTSTLGPEGTLYDLQADPDMTAPAADSPEAQAARSRLRAVIAAQGAEPPAPAPLKKPKAK